jgi:PiT family inorganic phosphate transporter
MASIEIAFWVVALLVVMALLFDFMNGFHDAANSIATVVSTGVLKPQQAVLFAAFFNVVAIAIFQLKVAATVAKAGPDALVGAGIWKTVAFIVISPLLGYLLGSLMMVLVAWICRNTSPLRVDRWFRRLQLVSAGLYSLGHGGNDAQKTIGLIWMLLIAAGMVSVGDKAPPTWVIFACYIAIGMGTMFGGWRIVQTMGQRITKLKPVGGFCAETGGAITLFVATALGVPVSTTHTITGAIVGVGSVQRASAVRWGVAGTIVWAWIFTIPASALMAGVCYWISFAIY